MSQLQVTGEAKIRDIQGPVVANSGVITALDGAASQYVRGDGTLADFPTSTGGGSSVSYYLNSSVSQGTIGGVAYRQFSKDPISGAGTDITISSNGYVASYITDANDPALLEVPAGNFNCEFYFSVNSNNHNPYVYAEVYKYDGTTFTLIGSSQSVPEYLTNGTTLSPYYFAIPVTQTVLTITDRIAIRIYVNVDTKVVTLHTENNHLCQVVTTFSKGLTSLNNLTRQVQFLATGTSGTDFAISSSTATHTFNLPVASATNTGKLSSTDWSTFNAKQPAGNYVTLDTTQTITAAKTFSLDILVNGLTIGEGAGSIATNTAIGSGALAVNTTGNENTAIGSGALAANTTGVQNNAIGRQALQANTTGFGNFAAGQAALFANTTGGLNIAIGGAALNNNTTANSNIAIGAFAGGFITTGSSNISIGTNSGSFITTGSNNTIIGSYNGTSTMSNNIVLADGAGNVRYRYDGTNNNLYGNVNFSSTIGNGTYTYTLPSATGTLALTSNLSAYLPLTGGTLTGALSGTSATFSSSLGVNSTIRSTGQTDPASGVGMELFYRAADTSSYIQSYDRTNGAWRDVKIYGNTLYFGSQGSNNLTITASGNFGINTSTPSSFGGYTNFTIKSGATGSNLDMCNSSGTRLVSFVLNGSSGAYIGSTTNIPFAITTNDSERISITGSGNVGIGTSSPTNTGGYATLTIGGNSTTKGQLTFNSSTTPIGYLYNDATNMNIGSENALIFATTSTSVERMRITSGGRGLFGTTTPSAGAGGFGDTSFQVNNEIVSIGSTSGFFWENRSGGTTVNSNWYGWYTTGGTIFLYNGAANAASITPSTGVYTPLSDINKKKDFEQSTIGLNAILGLKPTLYRMKTDETEGHKELGFIAQEVKEFIPQAFFESGEDENKFIGLNYNAIVAALVKSVQELKTELDELKNK